MFKSKAFWWTLLVAWLMGASYWHICQIRQLCGSTFLPSLLVENELSTQSHVAQIQKDSIERSLHASRNNDFAFSISGDIPDTSTIGSRLDSLLRQLQNTPHAALNIVGGYLKAENNHTAYANLGIARAEQIKKLAVVRGIKSETIRTSGLISKDAVIFSDSITGVVKLLVIDTIATVATVPANVDNEHKTLFVPIDMYFAFGSSDYIKTPENQRFLSEAKTFLASHRTRSLLLTGHTDNEDSAEWNLQLSIKRAQAIRKKLIALGISGSQIIATGKGETEPKESNNTIDGKRANRRVTMVVQ